MNDTAIPEPIPEPIRAEIGQRLDRAEHEHSVQVLMAIESGSRAWGFASTNSDFDARFIYRHPTAHYLRIDTEHVRDVIEYPIVDEIDINGWDLRKALGLLLRSNPAIVEWLISPITYRERGTFRERALAVLPEIYQPTRGIHHYRAMARSNFRGYLRDEIVPAKKYFYVLRPLLAARWIEQRTGPAPIEFERLLAMLPSSPALHESIADLLARKRAATEKTLIPRIEVINGFIEQEIERLSGVSLPDAPETRRVEALNGLFRELLDEAA